MDEGPLWGRRQVRAELVVATTVTSSAEAGRYVGRRTADMEERGTPAFDDLEEPKLEIVV